jgi:hypothetical protein
VTRYIGSIPDPKYYGYDQIKKEERMKFHKWHKEKRKLNYVFNFKEELFKYGWGDVGILSRAKKIIREEFHELQNIDPFQYLTIASVCMTISRDKYLEPNTIAVVDKEVQHNYTKKSICWLDYLCHKNKTHIQHALNGGEQKIILKDKGKLRTIRVDGYVKITKTEYQFQGCFWHGCNKCFRADLMNNKN